MNYDQTKNPEIGLNISDEQLRTMALALLPHLNRFGIEEKPMTRDKIAAEFGISDDTIDKLRREGTIEAHYFPNVKIPFYFPSELITVLKKRKNKV